MTATTAPRPPAPRWAALRWAAEARWPVSVGFAGALIGLWELWAATVAPVYIHGPSTIVADTVRLAADGTLGPLLGESVRRAATGFAIGAGLGAVIGLVAGVVPVVEDLVDPPVAVTYPFPKIALFPALAVLLGFDDRTRIVVIAVACFYPAYLNAHSGTRGINPGFLWLARNVGAGRLRTFTQVVVPAALPRLLVGLRISLALSFVLMFATEVIGFTTGIGAEIFQARLAGDYDVMWAGTAVIGLVGFVADRLLGAVSRRLLRGRELEVGVG